MVKISYIYPHRNRTELFQRNFESLVSQTDKDFEIIIVDNSNPDYQQKIKGMTSYYRGKGLNIKGFIVDPTKCKHSHSPAEYGGNFNPAVSQNVGVKQSSGDVVVLSSPEIVNANTNVETIKQLFADGESKFLLGWMEERGANHIPSSPNGLTVADIKTICAAPGRGAKCRPEAWKPINYFLGCIRREDFLKIGGIDERYMKGVGFEDDCFATRCEENGFSAQFCGEIAGVHLSHPRGYQGNLWVNPNHDMFKTARAKNTANVGEDWGSDSYIIERF